MYPEVMIGGRREFIDYTSSSVTTAGKKEFLYGRFEIRLVFLWQKEHGLLSGHWEVIWNGLHVVR